MSDKPCYYAVLGVQKTAKPNEIKMAHVKIAMASHPDTLRKKGATEKQLEEAAKKLQLATEARDVLMDDSKRATYDKYGHKGLDNLKSTGGGGGGVNPSTYDRLYKRPTSVDDAFDFFDQCDTPKPTTTKPATTGSTTTPAGNGDAERRKAWLERIKSKRGAPPAAEAKPQPQPQQEEQPVRDTFKEVSEQVAKTTSRLKTAEVPLAALEDFRKNLQDLMEIVDQSIMIARKNKNGPDLA